MTELRFRALPTVELLQWLARGSLKQNLLRSLRLWVWLKLLYGDELDSFSLPNSFKFTDWQKTFFTHLPTDDVPPLHEGDCNCKKTVAEWLKDVLEEGEMQWRNALKQHDNLTDESIDEILNARLFAVTRRSLQDDLRILVELGWLEKTSTTYSKISNFPKFPNQTESYTALHPDLEFTFKNFAEPLGGLNRFFLEVDYIISPIAQDRLEDCQAQLKELWQQVPTPPIALKYNSARLGKVVQCIVYPICLYYSRRAIYLCAFGETPTQRGNYYNYRLDRIAQMIPLSWQDSRLPELLSDTALDHLPKPEFIQEEMSKVWGFDFYLPSQLMLLRFEQQFHERYIKNTFRHETFTKINYQEAKALIQKYSTETIINRRSPDDAYYYVHHRDGDINVIHRLRAWRPHVEILLPDTLRQQMIEEIKKEAEIYA